MTYKKVKYTLVQALRFCTSRTAHRGSGGIAILFLDHGTRRGWGVSVTPRTLFTPVRGPVPIVQEAGWAPGSVWTGVKNLATTGVRTPDRPARSQSLYRLSYQAHKWHIILYKINLYVFVGLSFGLRMTIIWTKHEITWRINFNTNIAVLAVINSNR